MIDRRRAAILEAVVRTYIETTQPVSSAVVTQASGVDASPATIRAEMAALERDGYLEQPHTSAGRIPTDLAYRYFVDHLRMPTTLPQAQASDVRTFFSKASGEIELLLERTGRLLSDITGVASVVVATQPEQRFRIASIQVVHLGGMAGIVVVVGADGAVRKSSCEMSGRETFEQCNRLSQSLTQQFHGKFTDELQYDANVCESSDIALAKACMRAIAESGESALQDQVFIGGTARLARAFDAVETLRNVLSILEQHFVVVTLMRDLLERGDNVSIGSELSLRSLATCSLVVAPTVVEGVARGSVAVIGPTRMDYPKALAAVSTISKQLGEHLEA